MSTPRLYVDFNEMLDRDLVLLSKDDTKTDSHGSVIHLSEGLPVAIYSDDLDESGKPDNLIAEGIVERNKDFTGWSSHVKWCCRIDTKGIRHESDSL